MAEPTIQLGGGNWAGKTDNLLGYYKEGERFYKQDFTFSRSTTGTYTDKDGYIQEMPYNLLTYSEDLTNTYSRTNSTITSGQSGYNGTNDAWLFDVSVAGGNLRKNISVIGDNNFSIYAKKGSANGVRIRFDQDTDTNVYIDLTDGSVFTSANTLSVNVDSIGNGWYRINFSFVALGLILFRIYTTDGTTTTTTGSIFLQSPQLVKGTSAKTYFPTTTRLNMPRVSYLNNSNGSLILEPQRSNLIPYSEDFTQSYWAKANIAVTSNNAISPDGTLNADKLFETTGNGVHILVNNAITTNGLVTGSIYSKYLSRYLRLTIHNSNNANEWYSVIYDLENGTIYDDLAKTVTVFNCEIEQMPNDYYRCIITADLGLTSSTIFYIQTSNGASINLGDNRGRGQYQGDGTSGIYIWGAQLEQGSYPTTLINTSGSSVTRNADACSITNVADRIGQTEGTMFVDFVWNGLSSVITDSSIFSLGNQEYGNSSIAISNYNGTLYGRITNGTSIDASVNYGSMTLGTRYKCAIGYANNDFVFYVNGVQMGSDTSVSIPTRSDVYLQNAHPNSKSVNQAILYNTRLSNSELATLTT